MTAAEAQAARREAVQAELVRLDAQYRQDHGPLAGWSEAVWMSWRVDRHLAEQRATGWEVAA